MIQIKQTRRCCGPVRERIPPPELIGASYPCGVAARHEQRRFSGKLEWGYWRADPEGSDPGGKYLPVIYVSRYLEGLVDVTVGKPEFETE